MTTTLVSDGRSIVNECDNIGDWTATDGPTAFSASPSPIESTNCMGMNVSNTNENAYDTITSDDYSSGSLFVWMRPFGTMDTLANGGASIQVGDGTNRIAYHVLGSDQSGFRHQSGPIEWTCAVLDLGNKPANFVALAGAEANLNEAAITQVGVRFATIAKSVGGVENCFWDIIRWANPGDALVFRGGTTAGAAGNGSEIATIDQGTGNQQAYGVWRELGSGLYGIQGNITLGDTASSANQFWEETNVTYAWEERLLSTNNYYRFNLVGSSTATTCSFIFTGCTFVVPSANDALFNANGADIDVCTMDGCTFIGFTNTTGVGVETSDDTGDNWQNCSFVNCDRIDANGCDLSGSSVLTSNVAADEGALFYDLATDPDGELDNMTFSQGANAHHAIRFGTNVPSAMTLRNCAFNGFSATADANGATFRFDDTTGTITFNLVNCTVDGNPASDANIGIDDAAGVTVNLVIDPVTTQFTVEDLAGSPLQNVRVLAETADNGGGSGLPYQESVSITQSAGTATVTHTAHGLETNDYVVIRGAQPDGYNRVAQITVTGVNTYTMTVPSGLSSPATGTPVASYAPIGGQLTNASGVVSSSKTWPASQGLTGWARLKNASSPFYKDADINVSDASSGTNITLTLQPDE